MKAQDMAYNAVLRYLQGVSKAPLTRLKSIAAGAVREIERTGVEFKKPTDQRTLKQNAFIHVLFDRLGREMGYVDPELVKEGIKAKYGVKELNPITGKLEPKPTHRYETGEIDSIVNGVFIEAAEQGIDLSRFAAEWERIREKREAVA